MGFHSSAQPLTEEYTTIKNQWPLSDTDIAEVARNSVLQSGFTDDKKKELISEYYKWGGVAGNDPLKTDIPARRAAFRHEVRLEEYYWIFKKTRLHEIEQKKNEKKKLVSERTNVPLRNVTSNMRGVFTPKSKDKEEYMAQSVSVLVGKDQRWRWFSHTMTATIPGGKRWPIHWYDLVDESMKRDSKVNVLNEDDENVDERESTHKTAARVSVSSAPPRRRSNSLSGRSRKRSDSRGRRKRGRSHSVDFDTRKRRSNQDEEKRAEVPPTAEHATTELQPDAIQEIKTQTTEVKTATLPSSITVPVNTNHSEPAGASATAGSPTPWVIKDGRLDEDEKTRVRALIARRKRKIE